MAVIADSSPLISLVKIGKLDLLNKLYEIIIIPRVVFNEVVTAGKRLHKTGAKEIEHSIQAGWIKTVDLTPIETTKSTIFQTRTQIGRGEAEAVSLAFNRQLSVIIDDRYARELANTLDLEFWGTAAVLLEAFESKLLDKHEFIASLRELGKVMWLSPEVMAELLRLAEEVERWQ